MSSSILVVLEDELYIIGGWFGVIGYSRNLHRLNKKMEWEKLADMHDARMYIENSCISYNGYIWVIGGCNERTRKRAADRANWLFSTQYIGGIWRDEVGVYHDRGWYRKTCLNTIEKYDPARNTWELKPAMKRGRYNAAAAVINDRIYVCGGDEDDRWLDSVEVFDLSSEVWTDFCTLPEPRSQRPIVVDGTSIVLIGGSNKTTVWKMDVEGKDKKWIDLPPLSEDRRDSSAVMIETGSILVFGGVINYKACSSVDIFSGQKWESFPPLPQKRAHHTSVVLTPAMIDAFRPYILPVE